MDGLLLSTEPIYFQCYQKAAAQEGVSFSFELFETCVGLSTDDSARLIDHHFQGALNIPQFYKRTYEHFENYIRSGGDIEFRPGAKEALEFFHRHGFKLALASSNVKRWVDYLMEKKGIKQLFSVMITSDDVAKPKPDPEIYLTTAQHLRVAPEACLVFEDSIAGATAAIVAGMRVCVVPQIKQPDSFVREHAFKIYKSLTDIYPDMDELLS